MRPNQSSLTAMGTAAQRAIEMEMPVDERICYDPIAWQFLPAWFYALMKRLTASGYAYDLSFAFSKDEQLMRTPANLSFCPFPIRR